MNFYYLFLNFFNYLINIINIKKNNPNINPQILNEDFECSINPNYNQ